MPLRSDDRGRLLLAAENRPLGEQLLAHLVLDDGLTLAQAVSVRAHDLSSSSVTVETKTGQRETRTLSPQSVELARRVIEEAAPDTALVTGRTGRQLTPAAARNILLGLARASGVPVASVHELRSDRHTVAAA
jgi:integrase